MFPIYHALVATKLSGMLVFCGLDTSGNNRIWVCSGISSNVVYSFISPITTVPTYGVTYAYGDLVVSGAGFSINTPVRRLTGFTSTVKSGFSMPLNGGNGLTFDGTNLWWSRQRQTTAESSAIYEMSGLSGTIIGGFVAPRFYPSGLSNDGPNLLSTDRYSPAHYYVHVGYTSPRTLEFTKTTVSGLVGIASDGTDLITYKPNTNRIYVHNGYSSSYKETIVPPSNCQLIYDMEYIPEI